MKTYLKNTLGISIATAAATTIVGLPLFYELQTLALVSVLAGLMGAIFVEVEKNI